MEPHHESPSQGLTGTTPSSNGGSPLLAQCDMVSSPTTSSFDGSLTVAPQAVQTTSPVTPHRLQQKNWMLSVWLLSGKNLNHYIWMIKSSTIFYNNVWPPQQLIRDIWRTNFLADMRQTDHLQATTLKTLRSAVAHLHNNPSTLSENNLVSSYLDSLVKQASPVSIHCPTLACCDLYFSGQRATETSDSGVKKPHWTRCNTRVSRFRQEMSKSCS